MSQPDTISRTLQQFHVKISVISENMFIQITANKLQHWFLNIAPTDWLVADAPASAAYFAGYELLQRWLQGPDR